MITLTRHAKDRLRERHGKFLTKYIDDRGFNLACYELMGRAVESRRHLNDQQFMIRLYEKHGYDCCFRFLEFKNALFVITNNVCLTVLDTNTHRTSRQFANQKKY